MKIGLNQLPIWSLDGTICSRNLKSFPTFSIGKKEKKENTFLTNKCYPNSPPDISPSSSIFTNKGVEKPNQLIWQHGERELYIYNRLASDDHSNCSCPLFHFGWPVLLVEIGLFPIQTDSKPSHPAKPKLNPTPKDLIPASPKLTSLLFSLHHDPTLSTASSFFFFSFFLLFPILFLFAYMVLLSLWFSFIHGTFSASLFFPSPCKILQEEYLRGFFWQITKLVQFWYNLNQK